MQVIGNGTGDVISLGTRDCSLQRRHQKVIEEAPAPNISSDIERNLCSTAERLMQQAAYLNAGTVEFIYDAHSQEFYFLEVNTRLQVEHGVTESIYQVDLVEWMLRVAYVKSSDLSNLRALKPQGHAIQARIYAEDPLNGFRPSSDLINDIHWPTEPKASRIDTWITPGCFVSPLYDPLLAKIIVHSDNRKHCIDQLLKCIQQTEIWAVQNNLQYLAHCLDQNFFKDADMHTRCLDTLMFSTHRIDVLQPGTQTTIQDLPGRVGYWDIGIPPSGPFDDLSFKLGNQLLGNTPEAAGLEITLNGPTLKFHHGTNFCLTGADIEAHLNNQPVESWEVIAIKPGDILSIGKIKNQGTRAYLLIQYGIQCPKYLGSRSTFTLGEFGGYAGRALKTGDSLHCMPPSSSLSTTTIASEQAKGAERTERTERSVSFYRPLMHSEWVLHATYGPHGAPEFFTEQDIHSFFQSTWKVHYNSSRTGIRLIGPKPQWARTDGGEAGLHPSNIHDNAYAFGTVDFTGDMPVILGPDGPSLGGFVCPATVIQADRWKLGQLKAGDTVKFQMVSLDSAHERLKLQRYNLPEYFQCDSSMHSHLNESDNSFKGKPSSQLSSHENRHVNTHVNTHVNSHANPLVNPQKTESAYSKQSPILKSWNNAEGLKITYRLAGDHFVLVEYGDMALDFALRFRIQALYLAIQNASQSHASNHNSNHNSNHHELNGIIDLTPGIRSLQIHFDPDQCSFSHLLQHLEQFEDELGNTKDLEFDSRIIHLPLSWDDPACQQAIDKYSQSVRSNAPWCPSNLEFIRRINGLDDIESVKTRVFRASYLVLGLGDVYLGAPVAVPLDPAHRLVTTKYNPARTWTAENSVGIGGAYLCIYGMEGPGGYQFIGRTLQMWNRYKRTDTFDKPWLLRHFDQIQFYPVTAEKLQQIREDFPLGRYPLKIEHSQISLSTIEQQTQKNLSEITKFQEKRKSAFNNELQLWKETGQLTIESPEPSAIVENNSTPNLNNDEFLLESSVSGHVWKMCVDLNQPVSSGETIIILESMKMEFPLQATQRVAVQKWLVKPGMMIEAGKPLAIMKPL